MRSRRDPAAGCSQRIVRGCWRPPRARARPLLGAFNAAPTPPKRIPYQVLASRKSCGSSPMPRATTCTGGKTSKTVGSSGLIEPTSGGMATCPLGFFARANDASTCPGRGRMPPAGGRGGSGPRAGTMNSFQIAAHFWIPLRGASRFRPCLGQWASRNGAPRLPAGVCWGWGGGVGRGFCSWGICRQAWGVYFFSCSLAVLCEGVFWAVKSRLLRKAF
jgi:hypothetical protein